MTHYQAIRIIDFCLNWGYGAIANSSERLNSHGPAFLAYSQNPACGRVACWYTSLKALFPISDHPDGIDLAALLVQRDRTLLIESGGSIL